MRSWACLLLRIAYHRPEFPRTKRHSHYVKDLDVKFDSILRGYSQILAIISIVENAGVLAKRTICTNAIG